MEFGKGAMVALSVLVLVVGIVVNNEAFGSSSDLFQDATARRGAPASIQIDIVHDPHDIELRGSVPKLDEFRACNRPMHREPRRYLRHSWVHPSVHRENDGRHAPEVSFPRWERSSLGKDDAYYHRAPNLTEREPAVHYRPVNCDWLFAGDRPRHPNMTHADQRAMIGAEVPLQLASGASGLSKGLPQEPKGDEPNNQLNGREPRERAGPEGHVFLCFKVRSLPLVIVGLVGLFACLTGILAGKYLYRLVGGGYEAPQRFDGVRVVGILALGIGLIWAGLLLGKSYCA